MSRKMKLKVAFDNAQESRPVTYKMKMLVRNAIEATLDEEQYENPCEVSVTFTDNEGIHALNRQYRGVDRPTDVLSFPLFDYEGTSEEPPVDECRNRIYRGFINTLKVPLGFVQNCLQLFCGNGF